MLRTAAALILALALCLSGFAFADDEEDGSPAYTLGTLSDAMLAARQAGDPMIAADYGAFAPVVGLWNTLYVEGADAVPRLSDPAEEVPAGRRAIVVLGLELVDGEMQEELRRRCDLAAEAARAWPEAILICSGGATGENNPEAHTESGMMKAYLSEACGIDPDRIFIDERALTTVGNAVNTYVILREQGVESMTIVSSSYHLRRAQILYLTIDLFSRSLLGCGCELASVLGCDREVPEGYEDQDAAVAAFQVQACLAVLAADEAVATAILTAGGAY